MKFFAFLLSIVAGVFLAIVVVKPKGEKYLEMLNKSTVRPTFDINQLSHQSNAFACSCHALEAWIDL